jgi:hypothetical protein
VIHTKPLAHSSPKSEMSDLRIGDSAGRGLLLLLVNYWAANMDDWDPKLTNGFAAEREVILFDNAGSRVRPARRRRRSWR